MAVPGARVRGDPVTPLTLPEVQMLAELRSNPAVFEVFCSGCPGLDGPSCCRTPTPASSWWRRLLNRKDNP